MNYTFSVKAKGRMFGEDVSSRPPRVRLLCYVPESIDFGATPEFYSRGIESHVPVYPPKCGNTILEQARTSNAGTPLVQECARSPNIFN